MNNQPRRLLILRWTRDHPPADAPARWLIDRQQALRRANRPGNPGVAAAWAPSWPVARPDH
jgi:hypothetical protein